MAVKYASAAGVLVSSVGHGTGVKCWCCMLVYDGMRAAKVWWIWLHSYLVLIVAYSIVVVVSNTVCYK